MITPEQIAKTGTEHAHQAALFCWAAQYINSPHGVIRVKEALARMFAIPNGDQRGDGTHKGAQIAGARLKAEGMKPGVMDIFLAYPSGGFHGLFIEMKKPGMQKKKNGGCSDEQMEFTNLLQTVAYDVRVCYSWEEARQTILHYLRST